MTAEYWEVHEPEFEMMTEVQEWMDFEADLAEGSPWD